MPDEKPLFTSDRRSPSSSSWADDVDWEVGSRSNVEVVGGGIVPREFLSSTALADGIEDLFEAFDASLWTLSGGATYDNSTDRVTVTDGSRQHGYVNWDGVISTDPSLVTMEADINWDRGVEFVDMRMFSDVHSPTDSTEAGEYIKAGNTYDNGSNRWETRVYVVSGGDSEVFHGGALPSGGIDTWRLEFEPLTGSIQLSINGVSEIDEYTTIVPTGNRLNFGANSGQNPGTKHYERVAFSIE